MTRDELIEVLTRTLVGEDATDDHLKFCRSMGANVLAAIEAQGMAIVPVKMTDAQFDACAKVSWASPEIYDAFIAAGRI